MFRYSHLHSTMFLLIHQQQWTSITMCPHLHSTMFLLIRYFAWRKETKGRYLHSTMFLLIHERRIRKTKREVLFTFHNVSINTRLSRTRQDSPLTYLHSTMFLLIPILHNPLYYKPNSTIFCQPCHLLYLSNTIFNNIMKIFLFLQ